MLSIIYNIYTQFHCIVCAISKIREQNEMDIVVFDDVWIWFECTCCTFIYRFYMIWYSIRSVLLILIQCKIIVFFISKNISSNKNELLWGCYSATWENDLILMATTVQARKFSFSCLILTAWGYQIQRYFFSLILL